MRITTVLSTVIWFVTLFCPIVAARDSQQHWRSKVLQNGLRVYFLEDNSVDTVTVYVTYLIGSSDDPVGACGRAHLLEHMMFRGSEHVASGEHALWIRRVGGEVQGSTGFNRTVFYETVPARDLTLALYLEADRMRSLLFSPSALDQEKHIVESEAMTKSNTHLESMRAIAVAALGQTAEAGCPVAGTPGDIGHITLSSLRWAYDQFYTPQNASLTIVGHCKPGRTISLAKHYFGGIQKTGLIADKVIHPLDHNKMVIVRDTTGSVASLYIFFDAGTPFERSWYSDLIFGLWFANSNSVPHKSLAERTKGVRRIRFFAQPREGGTLATILIESESAQQLAVLEEKVTQIIDDAMKLPMNPDLLTRLKNSLASELTRDWITTAGKADALSQSLTLYGRVYYLDAALQQLSNVDNADVISSAAMLSRDSIEVVTQ
jgi:zinc protease